MPRAFCLRAKIDRVDLKAEGGKMGVRARGIPGPRKASDQARLWERDSRDKKD